LPRAGRSFNENETALGLHTKHVEFSTTQQPKNRPATRQRVLRTQTCLPRRVLERSSQFCRSNCFQAFSTVKKVHRAAESRPFGTLFTCCRESLLSGGLRGGWNVNPKRNSELWGKIGIHPPVDGEVTVTPTIPAQVVATTTSWVEKDWRLRWAQNLAWCPRRVTSSLSCSQLCLVLLARCWLLSRTFSGLRWQLECESERTIELWGKIGIHPR